MTTLGFRYKSNRNNVTDSVGLLISILLRYPEVATINFDPDHHLLKFTFIYLQVLGNNELKPLKKNCWTASRYTITWREKRRDLSP